MKGEMTLIIDLGFGSSGKGQIAYMVAKALEPDGAACAFGPNAGHSVHLDDDNKYVHTMLPIGALAPSVKKIFLGPGAVINLESVRQEIFYARHLLKGKTIYMHPNAMILHEDHVRAEARLVTIGSTMKGTMEAMVDKMRRDVESDVLARQNLFNISKALEPLCMDCGIELWVDAEEYDNAIGNCNSLLVEGAQGHSLGIHTQFWPHCTSRDVSVHQVLADCRVPSGLFERRVIGVHRTCPIRVANRYNIVNNEPVMVGTSGPCYSDQTELDWDKDLHRPAELTTVTRLPRRVFSYSSKQVKEACRLNHPDGVILTFMDYLLPGDHPYFTHPQLFNLGAPLKKVFGSHVVEFIEQAARDALCPIVGIQFGPLPQDLFAVDGSGGEMRLAEFEYDTLADITMPF